MLANSMGQIYRWDLATKKELPILTNYKGGIVGLHDIPDGKTLIAVGEDGVIHRFDTRTNREIPDIGKYEGSPAVAVSPDRRLAVVGDRRGRLDLWELHPLKFRRTLRSGGPAVVSIAFAADGKTLAAGLKSEIVCSHDVASGRETRTISFKGTEELHWYPFSALLLSPDGRFLYLNNSVGELLLWDVDKEIARWRCKGEFASAEGAAALSPDGKTLAFAPEGTEVLLVDALTGKKRLAVKLAVNRRVGNEESVQCLAFSPDGDTLAVALGDGTIALVDSVKAEEGKRLASNSYLTGNLAFSPDGRTIAAGVMESVCLWDTATGKLVSRLEGHTDSVQSVGFGPDGRVLLSSAEDSQVYVWSLETKSGLQKKN